MPLVLYIGEACPASRAVWMTCMAAGLDYEVKKLDLLEEMQHLQDWFTQISPTQRTPALSDDEFFLSESHAIMRYVMDAHSNNEDLYPRDPRQRALVNQFLDYDLGVLARVVHNMTWPEIFEHKGPQKLTDIRIVLAYLNNDTPLAENKYIAGDHMTIADLSALAHVTFLEPIYFDFSTYPNVKSWVVKMKAMEFYGACNDGYRKWKKAIRTPEWRKANKAKIKRYGKIVAPDSPKSPRAARTDLKNRVYQMLVRQDTI